MEKYKNLILDGNNLFWRHTYDSLEKFLTIENHPVYPYIIEQSIQKINKLITEFGYKSSLVFILLDNPMSKINYRKILTDGKYKHSRDLKDNQKNLYKTLNILIEVLKNYSSNFRIVQNESLEADDLTKPVLDYIKPSESENCLLISADLDWARNIGQYSHWYNYYTSYTPNIFLEKYGFNPIGKSIQIWKALKGDNSDCIENAVPHLPEEILKDILNKFKDIQDLYKNLWDQNYPEKWKSKLKEAEIQVKINYQLVDFIEIEESIDEYIYICNENIDILRFWYNLLQISFENRMIDKNDIKNFFVKKKIRKTNK